MRLFNFLSSVPQVNPVEGNTFKGLEVRMIIKYGENMGKTNMVKRVGERQKFKSC